MYIIALHHQSRLLSIWPDLATRKLYVRIILLYAVFSPGSTLDKTILHTCIKMNYVCVCVCVCACVCVPVCVCVCVCLTTNERIDGEPRTPGSTAGQRSSRRSVSSLRGFVHVRVAMKVKFALEQPSSTGVGHELARSCTCYCS